MDDDKKKPAEPPYRFENGKEYVPPKPAEPPEPFIPDRGFDAPA